MCVCGAFVVCVCLSLDCVFFGFCLFGVCLCAGVPLHVDCGLMRCGCSCCPLRMSCVAVCVNVVIGVLLVLLLTGLA